MGDPQSREGAAPLLGHRVQRFSEAGAETAEVALPLEEPLAIEVDGRLVAVLMRTPGAEKALAVGYCLTEGLIRSLGDVTLLHHCGSGLEDGLLPAPEGEGAISGRNRVRLRLTSEASQRLQEAGPPARWVFSGCGGVDVAALGEELRVPERELRVLPATLWGLVPVVARAQDAYRATGGIHAAALFNEDGELVALAEDVGRHNAADKAVGQAALAGRLPASILVATGRASSDIVAKAARVGIPIVASFSSSTSLAVRLAEAAGVTLIGYLRRSRFTVYTHAERVWTF